MLMTIVHGDDVTGVSVSVKLATEAEHSTTQDTQQLTEPVNKRKIVYYERRAVIGGRAVWRLGFAD